MLTRLARRRRIGDWLLAVLLSCSLAAAWSEEPAHSVSPQISPTASTPRRVIIDSDPGIDDAMAILLALRSPELHVEAVTVVAGNVTAETGAENALRVLALAHRADIPVAMGARAPLLKTLTTSYEFHGPNGLGGLEIPRSSASLDRRHAVDLIIELAHAHPQDLTLVAIGPLTNLALALRKDPGIRPLLSEIILMGGSTVGGNATPAAEFNIYNDPEAARIVFEAGVPITMVGINAALQTLLTPADVSKLKASGSCVGTFAGGLGDFYLQAEEANGHHKGGPLYDPLAVAIAIDKSLATTTRPARVDVETRGELTYGETVVNFNLSRPIYRMDGDHQVFVRAEPVAPNTDVPTVIAGERFISMLLSRLTAGHDGC